MYTSTAWLWRLVLLHPCHAVLRLYHELIMSHPGQGEAALLVQGMMLFNSGTGSATNV